MGINLTSFRKNLYQHVKEVLADDTGSLTISTKEGEVELVNSAELSSLREFHHLFSSPTNARRLLDSIERTQRGVYRSVSLEELRRLAETS